MGIERSRETDRCYVIEQGRVDYRQTNLMNKYIMPRHKC